MNQNVSEAMMIGKKNILVAREILEEYKIKVVAQDVGGYSGRKIQLNLEYGKVLMKYSSSPTKQGN